MQTVNSTYTAFDGFHKLITDSLEEVLLVVKKRLKSHREAQILIFSDLTGKQMDFDLSGSSDDILERYKIFKAQAVPAQSVVGRPKLGVVAREISLLPQQWEWLNQQTGGSSAAIRLLIDEKMKINLSSEKMKTKMAQEVTYKFLSAIAGDLPHFEEAIRFLYRADRKKFMEMTLSWEVDIVEHALKLAKDVF